MAAKMTAHWASQVMAAAANSKNAVSARTANWWPGTRTRLMSQLRPLTAAIQPVMGSVPCCFICAAVAWWMSSSGSTVDAITDALGSVRLVVLAAHSTGLGSGHPNMAATALTI